MQLEKLIYLSLEALVIRYEGLMYDFSPIISRKLIWYKPLQEYTTSDTSFSTFLPNLWKTVIFIGTKKWQTYTTIVVHQQQNNVIFPRDGIMCSHSSGE